MHTTQQPSSDQPGPRNQAGNPFAGFRKKTFRLQEALRQLAALGPRLADICAIWGRKRLDPRLREEVMVAVARTNACRFCNFIHGQWALAQGITEGELARIGDGKVKGGASPDRELAFAYAQTLAAGDLAPAPPGLASEMTKRFGWTVTRDVETVARVMTLANLSANTAEALVSRVRGRPAADSRLVDELVIAACFALVYPAMILVIAGLRRRSPLALLHDFANTPDPGDKKA